MIGIMMLDTKFPRLPGDIGNPASFTNPPLYRRVSGASVQEVVSDKPVNASLLESFQDTAVKLQHEGAAVIGTSCGFLGSVQAEIESVLKIPFLSSSLILIPILRSMFGANSVIGVLTFDESKLGATHFGGAIDRNISIHGLSPASSYRKTIAADGVKLDQDAARRDSIEMKRR